MLRVRVICTGKLKEKFYTDACAEYVKRLSRYCRPEVIELPESGDLPEEGKAVLANIPAGSYVIALCVEGEERSSEQLARMMGDLALRGCSRVCFLLGSSTGLAEEVKKKADFRLSMSPMTFPHHLARVMVLEQIYRAFTIQEGSGYHK